MEYAHRLEFKVRDYECDLQGIVNNSVYQNYLEHARHEFLLSRGCDFSALASEGKNLVVTHAALSYIRPLKSGDAFWVGSKVSRKGKLRFVFEQSIYRIPEDQCMLSAVITGTTIDRSGKPIAIKEPDDWL